jgi:SAM-dependent methyltransferase
MSEACSLCHNQAKIPAGKLGIHCEGLACEHCGCNIRNRFFYSALESVISELSRGSRALKALEVSGFGYARKGSEYVASMMARGVEIVCGDFYEQNFRAQERVDLTRMQFPNESFDIIGHSHVLEHVEDDMSAIRECFRCLRVGGILLLSIPIQTDFTFSPVGEYHGDNALVYRRNGWDVIDKLKSVGFHVEVRVPAAHVAVCEASVCAPDALVLDNIRFREKFSLNFERHRSLFYTGWGARYSTAHRFSECWGQLEVFWARKPACGELT